MALCSISTLVLFEAVFGTWMAHNSRRLHIERNKAPLFSALARGQIGITQIKHPSIQVHVYEEFLVIDAHKRFLLRYEQIKRVDLLEQRDIAGQSLQIHHCGAAPHRLLLTTPYVNEMRDLIADRIGSMV
jgi:hypothetical protein